MPYADKTKLNLSAQQLRALLGAAAPPAGFAPVAVTTGPE